MKKFSIITICYNEVKNISRTIESVLNQNINEFEYIIVDGCSNDGSVEIIKSYIEKFEQKEIEFKFISEKDSGIYNAMNKGIALAEGEYINMLNAGDCFANENVLGDVAINEKGADILYGDIIKIRENIFKIEKALPSDKIIDNPIFYHQATFSKTNLLKAEPFNEQYKIAADYNFFLNQYIKEKTFQYIDMPIAYYNIEGISSTNQYQATKEIMAARHGLGLTDKNSKKNKKILNKIKLKDNIKKILPKWFLVVLWKRKVKK